ncbi:MAG: glycosyltransferase family 2 protein [Verrucomicrobiae bacterium]|nr:glycosyltransferase family 2 protein [Verrucomicrobiae bacterium]
MSISVLIFTKNEELHIGRCLDTLRVCDDVVVIDSFSEDKTVQIAKDWGARVQQHVFSGFGDQRSWALENVKLHNEWALILDADEVVTPQLWKEMLRRVHQAPKATAAFAVRRRFYWRGRWIPRSSQYPTWVVRLIRVGWVRYVNRGHSETQVVNGKLEWLWEDLVDENLKGVDAFRQRQMHYAREEAIEELTENNAIRLADFRSPDPLARRAAGKAIWSRLPCRGLLFFIYVYFVRGGILEGSRGLELCWHKARYQSEIARLKKALRAKRPTEVFKKSPQTLR